MLLRTKGITKQFNGVYALKNTDFEIEAGEIHGLVGENGAGKSTVFILLMLARFTGTTNQLRLPFPPRVSNSE